MRGQVYEAYNGERGDIDTEGMRVAAATKQDAKEFADATSHDTSRKLE